MKKLISRLLALCVALSLTALPVSALDLQTAKDLLATYYVDGVPQEILELDSLDEILDALGDPYTYYMDSESYEDFVQSVNGQVVVGIGVSIETAYDSGYRIMSVLPDSPALEAGLQPGDRLVAVDGEELSAAVDPRVPIAGEEGTPVRITVDRDGQRLDFSLVRRAVTIPIVTYRLVDGAAYIDCVSFGSSTPATFREAIETLDDQTAVWLVDLRSNPGGDSDSTALSAGLFTGGDIMLFFRDSNDTYYRTYLVSDYPDLTDKPAILLTSSHSASGAELFAGDIRDYGAGIAVGQRTFGKGIAQIVFNEKNAAGFSNGEALKVTVYRFFSPDGATNHIVGVLPTLLISEENTSLVGLLLSQPKPARAVGHLKLELAGQTLYLDLEQALSDDYREAFTELLEALPPSAVLSRGSGTQIWDAVIPAQLAEEHGLAYEPRGFSDAEGSPYQREIQTLAAYDLLSGYGDGTFRPDATVTRAEFCAMVSSALDLPSGDWGRFSDVSSGAWYSGAVSAMADMGFFTGFGDGTFRPNDTISYEQMVTALSAVADWASMEGHDLAQQALSAQEWLNYYDYADWAQIPARNLAQMGTLLDGTAPNALVTREMAAVSLCRLMEHIGLIWD